MKKSVVAIVAMMCTAGVSVAQELGVAPLNPEFKAYLDQRDQSLFLSETVDGYGLGYVPPMVDLKALNPGWGEETGAQRETPLGAVPTAWDWRAHNGVTPVKNQLACGSCWTFGNLGSLESRLKILLPTHPSYNFSEENMNSAHLPWLWKRCEGGNTFVALSYLTNVVKRTATWRLEKGYLNESQDPYVGSGAHNPALEADATRPLPVGRITGARWISNNATEMKNAIYTKGPIVTAYFAQSPGGNHWYSGNTIYHWPGYSGSTNHEVLIVGWDDNKPHPTGGGKGAWLVKNSWGNFNSLGGYFWLTYGSAKVGSDGMYYIGARPYAATEYLYMEDKPGWIYNVGCGSNVAYGLNVFIPKNTGEKLTQVEFFSPFKNMPYTIKVWGTVAGTTTNPTVSGLLATKTGTGQEPGYYTVPLTTPIALTVNKKYAVEIRFQGPSGYGYPVPVAGKLQNVVGAFAGTGNATGYGRCAASGAFQRWVISGDTMVPNVRALTKK